MEDNDLSQSLDRMSSFLLSEETLDQVLGLVAALARSSIPGADGVGITLKRNGAAITAAHSDEFVVHVDQEQFASGQGPCLSAIEEERTFVVHATPDERWPVFTTRASAANVSSVLSIPLSAADGTIGALNIYGRAPHAFDDYSTESAARFARHAAVLLSNAQAFASTQQLADNLEIALKTRETIGIAKGILMERDGLTREEAFEVMRVASQDTNTKVNEIARRIVEGE